MVLFEVFAAEHDPITKDTSSAAAKVGMCARDVDMSRGTGGEPTEVTPSAASTIGCGDGLGGAGSRELSWRCFRFSLFV